MLQRVGRKLLTINLRWTYPSEFDFHIVFLSWHVLCVSYCMTKIQSAIYSGLAEEPARTTVWAVHFVAACMDRKARSVGDVTGAGHLDVVVRRGAC